MESCEVLIVGGGPAGSSCAWALRQAGVDVLVLDKSAFPRDKICAGWITPQVLQTLQVDTEDYSRGRTFQPITGFRTGLIAPNAVDTRYDEVVSYGIRRREFDHYLLQRAGARLRLGEPLCSLERREAQWLVNGDIAAKMLIGAGGHFCPVARHVGAALGREEQPVSAQEIEFEMSAQQAAVCRVAPDLPELYFCTDLKGYAWCFRKQNYLNIGLGREDNHRLAEHVSAFCRFLHEERNTPADLPGRLKGHAYLLYPQAPRPVAAEAALVIGDAAGLAYPQSGEGIRPAVESGLMAAQAIIAAAGDYRTAQLSTFTSRLTARFGARESARPASSPFVQKLRTHIGRALMGNHWFVREVVLNRWFLHLDMPALSVPLVAHTSPSPAPVVS